MGEIEDIGDLRFLLQTFYKALGMFSQRVILFLRNIWRVHPRVKLLYPSGDPPALPVRMSGGAVPTSPFCLVSPDLTVQFNLTGLYLRGISGRSHF